MLDDTNYHLNRDWCDFLRQIAEAPYDRFIRRVASDWLEESGLDPARVAFIRSQCDRSEGSVPYGERSIYSPLETKLLAETGPWILPPGVPRDLGIEIGMKNYARWAATYTEETDKTYLWNLETSFPKTRLACWYEDGFPAGLVLAVGGQAGRAAVKKQILGLLARWPIRTIIFPVFEANNYIVTGIPHFSCGNREYVYHQSLNSTETTGKLLLGASFAVREWIGNVREGKHVFPRTTHAPALLRSWGDSVSEGRQGRHTFHLVCCRDQNWHGEEDWLPSLLPGF